MSNRTQRLPVCCLATVCAVTLLSSAAQADPKIHSVNPPAGPLMSFATIHGEDFGHEQGRNYVRFGDRQITVIAWSDQTITVLINPMSSNKSPMALDTAYPIQVVKLKTDSNDPGGPDNPPGTAVDKRSNSLNCLLTSGPPPVYNTDTGIDGVPTDETQIRPIVENLQSRTYHNGDLLIVHGRLFGSNQGSGYVSISVPFKNSAGELFYQEYALPVVAWHDTQIQARLVLPAGAEMGAYSVTVHRHNGNASSAGFTVVGS